MEAARQGKLISVAKKDEAGKDLAVPAGVMLLSSDGVHALDAGQEIYRQVMSAGLKRMEASSAPKRHKLKSPLVADKRENAKSVAPAASMLSAGWKKVSAGEGLGQQFHDRLPEIWEARQRGEKIAIKFKGSGARLYDAMGPDGAPAVITLAGKASAPQPRCDCFSSYQRRARLTPGEGLEDTVHSVVIEIHAEQADRSAVVDVEKNKAGFDPKRHEGTVLRSGSIMLPGDIVR